MHHKYMDKNSKMRHPAQKSLFFTYFCAGKQLAGDGKMALSETLYGKLSLIHISEPTRLRRISYAVFCLKKKNIYTS